MSSKFKVPDNILNIKTIEFRMNGICLTDEANHTFFIERDSWSHNKIKTFSDLYRCITTEWPQLELSAKIGFVLATGAMLSAFVGIPVLCLTALL